MPREISWLLTHSHFDHVIDAAKLAAEADCPVYAYMVSTPESRLELLFRPMNLKTDDYPVQHLIQHGDTFQVGGLEIEARHVPGHSPDSLVFYIASENLVFTGDTLMCGTIGRTDFPGGGTAILVKHIREQIMVLPDDTAVLAGHMEATTVGEQRNMIRRII
jgi:hydroxyacylglutathione hydrolase